MNKFLDPLCHKCLAGTVIFVFFTKEGMLSSIKVMQEQYCKEPSRTDISKSRCGYGISRDYRYLSEETGVCTCAIDTSRQGCHSYNMRSLFLSKLQAWMWDSGIWENQLEVATVVTHTLGHCIVKGMYHGTENPHKKYVINGNMDLHVWNYQTLFFLAKFKTPLMKTTNVSRSQQGHNLTCQAKIFCISKPPM